MSKKPPGSYPRQQHPSYPTQPTYPTQPYAQAPPGAQQLPTGYNQSYPSYSQHTTAPPYGVPPPPYSATVNPQNQLHAGTLPVTAGYQYVHPQLMPQQMYGQPPHRPSHMGQPMVAGTFDSGVRFGAGATANIPPPPPGVAPTAAQMAAAQGQNVVMQQRPAGWMEGGAGGGYTMW